MRRSTLFGLSVLVTALVTPAGHAVLLAYDGEFFLCTVSCDAFDALGAPQGGSSNTVASIVSGFVDVPVAPDGTFSIDEGDEVSFDFGVFNPVAPLEDPILNPVGGGIGCPPPDASGQICNAGTVNPLPIIPMVATVEGSGILGADGVPISGDLTITFTAAPLSNNAAVIAIDLATGEAEGTLFFGAITFARIAGAFSNADVDNDGIVASQDNCTEVTNPNQRDTDNDGLGNFCDADLNNDCIVNAADLGVLRSVFFSAAQDADFNGDGVVNFGDLGIMRTLFFAPPGPSGVANTCEPL